MIDLNNPKERKKIEGIVKKAAFSSFINKGELDKVNLSQMMDDIIHDIYCKILEMKEAGEDIEYDSSWIWTVTTNHCLNWMRKRKEKLLDPPISDDDNEFINALEALAEPDRKMPRKVVQMIIRQDYIEKARKCITQEDLDLYRFHKIYGLSREKTEKLIGKDFKKSFFYSRIRIARIKFLFDAALLDKKSFDYDSAQLKLSLVLDRLEKEKKMNKDLKHIKGESVTELAHCKMNKGEIGGPDGALSLFREAGEIWNSFRQPDSELYVAQMIGVCHKMQGDYLTALSIFKSIEDKIRRKRRFQYKKGDIYRDIGSTYLYLNDIANAKNYMENSVNYNENMGVEHFRVSQKYLGEFYINQKKYDHAYNLIQDSFKDIPKYNVLHHLKGRIALSQLFLSTGDQDRGFDILKKGRKIAREYGFNHQYQFRIRPIEIKYQQSIN